MRTSSRCRSKKACERVRTAAMQSSSGRRAVFRSRGGAGHCGGRRERDARTAHPARGDGSACRTRRASVRKRRFGQLKAALTTLGCKVNQFETETMEGLFKQRGYGIVPFDEAADVYVINTCSVTSLGDRKSRQVIRRAHRTNPAAIIAVCGCYSQVAPDAIRAIKGVRVVLDSCRIQANYK